MVLHSQWYPLGRTRDPDRNRGDVPWHLFQLVGNKPRWIRFAHVYSPTERIAYGTTVSSITAPNNKNRDHGQGGIECTHPP